MPGLLYMLTTLFKQGNTIILSYPGYNTASTSFKQGNKVILSYPGHNTSSTSDEKGILACNFSMFKETTQF